MADNTNFGRGRLGLVVRVSDVRGRDANGDRFISPREQVRVATAYARASGWDVFVLEPMDLDVSHATPLDRRPAMGQGLRLVEAGELDGLVVSSQDRIGPLVVMRELQARLLTAQGVLKVADNPSAEVLDARGYAKLPSEQMALLHEAHREEIGKRWAAAQRAAVERGIHPARTPFGYRRDPETRRLVPVPEQAEALREAFRLRAHGGSLSEVCSLLESMGQLPGARRGWRKRGERVEDAWVRWHPGPVGKMLSNDVYLGVARRGELRREGAHEPIVTRAEFLAAQVERPVHVARGGDGALLSGIARCAACGVRMSPGVGQNRYMCRPGRTNGPPCTMPAYARMDELDAHVVQLYLARYEREVGDMTDEPRGPDVEPLRRALGRAEHTRDVLLDDLDSLAALPAGRRQEVVARAQRAVDEAQAALDRALVAHESSVVNVWRLSDFFTLGDFLEASVPEQRRLLWLGIERVEVARGPRRDLENRVRIVWADGKSVA